MYAENVLLQKNVCSKQVRGYFLVYSSLLKLLMFFYEKCVFRASRRLLFSLFIYWLFYFKKCEFKASGGLLFSLLIHSSTSKNVYSMQAGVSFLFNSSLIKRFMFYYEKCMFKASSGLLFSLFIINQYYKPNVEGLTSGVPIL